MYELFLVLASAIPAMAFAMIFSVPPKYLPFVACGGMVSFGIKYLFFVSLEFDLIVSCFIASCVISVMFVYIAPKLKVPRPVFTVASVIPILPGQPAFNTIINLIKIYAEPLSRDVYISDFFASGLLTTGVMLAIGIGIAMPPLFFYRNHPVV